MLAALFFDHCQVYYSSPRLLAYPNSISPALKQESVQMAIDAQILIEIKKKAVVSCLTRYNLSENPAINDVVLSYDCVPTKPSKKLAFLIMTYQREATTEDLKKISDQPAALIRELRKDGFIFHTGDEKTSPYYYRNHAGLTCRKIVGYRSPNVNVKGKVKSIIEKSVAACVSAIEIYNKPDFKYREETFSILLVNAWELLLKAKILSDNKNDMVSIRALDQDGKVKINRCGNPLTIEVFTAMQKLAVKGILDERCRENIGLLVEIRDNAIHFINKGPDFSKKVQEIGTASLRNYITAIGEWFGKDLSQYNFYLMPLSFFHLSDVESHFVLGRDKQMERALKYFRQVETNYPSDGDSSYSVTLQIKTQFVKTSANSNALDVRYSNNPNAPEIRVSEENIFKTKYPMTYGMLVEKLKHRYSNFRPDTKFQKIKKELEDREKHGEKFCRLHFLNVLEKKGSSRKFYSTEIFKEFDKHYKRAK
jgi:uncharacterized protein DUF3644